MRRLGTILALFAIGVLVYVSVPMAQPTGWLSFIVQDPQGVVRFRALGAYGQPVMIGKGTALPTAANSGAGPVDGEFYTIEAGGLEPVTRFFSQAAAAWRTIPTSTLATNAVDVANSVWLGQNSVNYEGATANGFEQSLVSSDVGQDSILGIPDVGEAGGSFVMSLLDTGANDVGDANAIWFGGTAATSLVFEGATGAADAFELMISTFDPGADRTVYIGDAAEAAGSFLLTLLDAADVGDLEAIWGNATGGLVFEGATADAFEVVIDSEDPTVGVQVQMFPDRAIADTFFVLTTHDGELTASQYFLPTGGGIPVDAGAAAEDALAADFQVVCYRGYLPHPITATNTVVYEFQVAAAGADDFLGFAIYDDDDAGVQLAEGATVYAADGAPLVINHGDVTLYPGFYRFCACQNDVSAQDWLGIAQTATVTAVYNQAVTEIRYGIATNACAGNADMPATTGALATTAEPMFVAHLQSN